MQPLYLQLYSFGFDSALSMQEKLQVTSQIGFAGVEFAGGYDNISTAQMKDWLQALQLEVVSAHVAMDAVSDTLPYMAELGARMLIIPGYPFANRAEALELAALLSEKGKEAARYGLKVGYHNHTSEFYVDQGKPLLDFVIENTDPAVVGFELDCGWASAAGIDPVSYIQQHAGRFIAIHVKENSAILGPDTPRSAHDGHSGPRFSLDENGKPIIPEDVRKRFEERMKINVPTGKGIVDWKAVKMAADAQGAVAYIVEREWSYNVPPDRIACLKEDFAYLQNDL